MPRYKKKITAQMDYEKFNKAIQDLPRMKRAFMSVLFFAGVRVSEALAITPDKIRCTPDMIYIDFHRLKGSKQTDPTPIPRTEALEYLCGLVDNPFQFHRSTAYRYVNQAFEGYYPHFFRQNRIVWIGEKYGDPTVYSYVGICAQSIDHYRGKVDIKKVGKALQEEIEG